MIWQMICYQYLFYAIFFEIFFQKIAVVVVRMYMRYVDEIYIANTFKRIFDLWEVKPASIVNAFCKPGVVKNG